jgi:metastasis-associated protein MTA
LNQLKYLLTYKKKDRGSVTKIANRLGNPGPVTDDWLLLTPADKKIHPEKISFPKPPKAADGSLLYERIPNKVETEKITLAELPTTLKRRALDDINGTDSEYESWKKSVQNGFVSSKKCACFSALIWFVLKKETTL